MRALRIESKSPELSPCRYRGFSADGKLCCEAVGTLCGLPKTNPYEILEDSCRACHSQTAPEPSRGCVNNVVASHVYRIASSTFDDRRPRTLGVAHAVALKCAASDWLDTDGTRARHDGVFDEIPWLRPRANLGCDVLIPVESPDLHTQRAIESALAQEDTCVTTHLLCCDWVTRRWADRFRSDVRIRMHLRMREQTFYSKVHELLPSLSQPFLAIQNPHTASLPHRIAYSVRTLDHKGADILGTAVRSSAGITRPQSPSGGSYHHFLPPSTLVFRRASLIDMGGFADRGNHNDEDAECIYRAKAEGRAIHWLSEPCVEALETLPEPSLGPAPAYPTSSRIGPSLREYARGFPRSRVHCDVVLPFHGQLNYVRAALESAVDQDNADVVVHLIDDASPEDTDSFLRFWNTHPSVRTYRNVSNLGQFASVNNVFDRLESELIAVQDGDDLSLPGRISESGNALLHSGADIYGAAATDIDEHFTGTGRDDIVLERARKSQYPQLGGGRSIGERRMFWRLRPFLIHPTSVFRKTFFEKVGGFADFGSVLRNRCGIDTEFYARAFHAGAQWHISRDVQLLYRRHTAQATKNNETGFGSEARAFSIEECARREQLYEQGRIPKRYRTVASLAHQTVAYP